MQNQASEAQKRKLDLCDKLFSDDPDEADAAAEELDGKNQKDLVDGVKEGGEVAEEALKAAKATMGAANGASTEMKGGYADIIKPPIINGK